MVGQEDQQASVASLWTGSVVKEAGHMHSMGLEYMHIH